MCRRREQRSPANRDERQKACRVTQWKTPRPWNSHSRCRQNPTPVQDAQDDMAVEDDETASVFPVRGAWWQRIQINTHQLGRSLTFILYTVLVVTTFNEWAFNHGFCAAKKTLRAPPKHVLDYNR